jgi:hypothetical protein
MEFEQPGIFRTLELANQSEGNLSLRAMCNRARLNAEAILEVEQRMASAMTVKKAVYDEVSHNQDAPAWKDILSQIDTLAEEEHKLKMENETMRREALHWKEVILPSCGHQVWAQCEKDSWKEKAEDRQQRKRKRESDF